MSETASIGSIAWRYCETKSITTKQRLESTMRKTVQARQSRLFVEIFILGRDEVS